VSVEEPLSKGLRGTEGLVECKASARNIRRIQVKDIVKEVEDYLKTYSSAGMDISWVDTMPINIYTINATTTTNVAQNAIDDNLPQLLDSRGAHEGPSDTRDTKIAALRLKFNAFKSLEGEKDSNSDVEEDQRTRSEFMADLNVEYHERALLANHKRFYKRFGRVGSARKPIDKSKETCFPCGKLVLTQRIDHLSKGKNEKGKSDKGKSEKGLIAESFDWDDESFSSEDVGTTKFKSFMAIAEDEPSVEG
nr:hypothetical protein [Tanacetum cinerariifolium]